VVGCAGLVVDETFVLVGGMIRVFILTTAARGAGCTGTGVAIGYEKKGT
jgi:hypothetical protein